MSHREVSSSTSNLNHRNLLASLSPNVSQPTHLFHDSNRALTRSPLSFCSCVPVRGFSFKICVRELSWQSTEPFLMQYWESREAYCWRYYRTFFSRVEVKSSMSFISRRSQLSSCHQTLAILALAITHCSETSVQKKICWTNSEIHRLFSRKPILSRMRRLRRHYVSISRIWWILKILAETAIILFIILGITESIYSSFENCLIF